MSQPPVVRQHVRTTRSNAKTFVTRAQPLLLSGKCGKTALHGVSTIFPEALQFIDLAQFTDNTICSLSYAVPKQGSEPSQLQPINNCLIAGGASELLQPTFLEILTYTSVLG